MSKPSCPRCGHDLGWRGALRQVLGPTRAAAAMWGAVCPSCQAQLKVPNARMLLIATAGIFFGSQSSLVLLVGAPSEALFWTAKLGLILLFYALATLIFFRLEPVE